MQLPPHLEGKKMNLNWLKNAFRDSYFRRMWVDLNHALWLVWNLKSLTGLFWLKQKKPWLWHHSLLTKQATTPNRPIVI